LRFFGCCERCGYHDYSRYAEQLEKAAKELQEANAQTEVLAEVCDVTDEKATAELFEKIKAKFGRLDVVVANVGVFTAGNSFQKIGEMAPAE
jgi:NAD(P)-dependent dehydrogenase (short-subunit alcohol dehydrogenase family)